MALYRDTARRAPAIGQPAMTTILIVEDEDAIRNNITRNMMFSNSSGPMQLVDDMRVVMMKEEVALLDSKDTDIFFIFNQQDEGDAGRITDLISEYYPVEALNIMPDGDDSYLPIGHVRSPTD